MELPVGVSHQVAGFSFRPIPNGNAGATLRDMVGGAAGRAPAPAASCSYFVRCPSLLCQHSGLRALPTGKIFQPQRREV